MLKTKIIHCTHKIPLNHPKSTQTIFEQACEKYNIDPQKATQHERNCLNIGLNPRTTTHEDITKLKVTMSTF